MLGGGAAAGLEALGERDGVEQHIGGGDWGTGGEAGHGADGFPASQLRHDAAALEYRPGGFLIVLFDKSRADVEGSVRISAAGAEGNRGAQGLHPKRTARCGRVSDGVEE